jgi:hypothetical protein
LTGGSGTNPTTTAWRYATIGQAKAPLLVAIMNRALWIRLRYGVEDGGLGTIVDGARHVSRVLWSRLGNEDLPETVFADIEQLRTYKRAAAVALAAACVDG